MSPLCLYKNRQTKLEMKRIFKLPILPLVKGYPSNRVFGMVHIAIPGMWHKSFQEQLKNLITPWEGALQVLRSCAVGKWRKRSFLFYKQSWDSAYSGQSILPNTTAGIGPVYIWLCLGVLANAEGTRKTSGKSKSWVLSFHTLEKLCCQNRSYVNYTQQVREAIESH